MFDVQTWELFHTTTFWLGYFGQYLKGISCQYPAQLSWVSRCFCGPIQPWTEWGGIKRTGQKTLIHCMVSSLCVLSVFRGLQIYLLVSVNRAEGRRQKKSYGSGDQTFTCTSSPLGSEEKQWRTQSDLSVKHTNMDHIKLQWAFTACPVTTSPTIPHFRFSNFF